ncbi:hypothetical protein [Escherichia coli]|uniref:hypothetical protein n=1 Tax=Escherichia coli TaxID=562 RepID=UPI001919B1EF|nr:hypothetical protein [Escherichia coli]CAD5736374.1 Uncharacterised protein [Escherichia coli]CAD5737035.1 Uncharacterised protein [Escherichia coli]CAD5749644.1 Uncharacterised protein [Escherichia coli]
MNARKAVRGHMYGALFYFAGYIAADERMFCGKIISSGKNGNTIVVLSGEISIPAYFHAYQTQFCAVKTLSRQPINQTDSCIVCTFDLK